MLTAAPCSHMTGSAPPWGAWQLATMKKPPLPDSGEEGGAAVGGASARGAGRLTQRAEKKEREFAASHDKMISNTAADLGSIAHSLEESQKTDKLDAGLQACSVMLADPDVAAIDKAIIIDKQRQMRMAIIESGAIVAAELSAPPKSSKGGGAGKAPAPEQPPASGGGAGKALAPPAQPQPPADEGLAPSPGARTAPAPSASLASAQPPAPLSRLSIPEGCRLSGASEGVILCCDEECINTSPGPFSPAHTCAVCKKPMHAFCGAAYQDANGQVEEGHGKPRVCSKRKCRAKKHANGVSFSFTAEG